MTTVIRWNPIREMATMQGALDRLFDESWRNTRGSAENGTLPLDVHETDNAYVVSATMPGVSANDINISLHDGVLTISGAMQQPTYENSRALLLERTYSKLQRSIRLPQPVVQDSIEALLENGVLTLTLPKTAEAQPRVIPVRTAQPSLN